MASAYLERSIEAGSNGKTFTYSVWFKLSNVAGNHTIIGLSSDNNSSKYVEACVKSNHKMDVQFRNGSSGTNGTYLRRRTNRLFRDVNAWYHFVLRVDSTQASASDRIRIYINGEQETDIDVDSTPDMPQNYVTDLNNSGSDHRLGRGGGSSSFYMDGCLTHFHLADGQSYAPTTFGETDATTGIWKPKTDPGISASDYGTNGFFLKMDNSANMGLDSSGNSHSFTTSGTIIQTKDTPSNVFATMNPIDSYWMAATYSNVNNKVVTQGSHMTSIAATLGASSGKYYWEVKVDDVTGQLVIGIDTKGASTCSVFSSGQCIEYTGERAYAWSYRSNSGAVLNNDSSVSYGNTYTAGDIIGVALDLDNNKIYWSKNGVFQNSGVPTSGSTGTGAIAITAASSTDTGVYFPACSDVSSSASSGFSTNFGNGYFGTTAVSSAQNPDDGNGIFEYDVPAGYRALCTKSLNAQEYS